MARRPDQRVQQPLPLTPGSRSGVSGEIQLDTTGLALDTSVQAVNNTLANPAQQSTLAGLLSQIATAGAQPFVPNMASASKILQAPGGSPYTVHHFTANSRIWGATISAGASTTGGSGSTSAYAQVLTGGGVTLAIVELIIAGTTAYDSDTAVVSIPGIPILSGDTLILDVNNGTGIGGGTMRASCTVLYSTP